jgi:hypothetical protein
MFGYGTPIHRAELSSAATEITISNINQNYTDLFFIAMLKSSFSTDTDWNNMWFNNDKQVSSGNYNRNLFYTNTTALNGSRSNSSPYHYGEQIATSQSVFNANEFSIILGYIPNYSSSSYYKTLSWEGGRLGNSTTQSFSWNGSATWLNTNAITSISMGTQREVNLVAGSMFELYGVKKVGQ